MRGQRPEGSWSGSIARRTGLGLDSCARATLFTLASSDRAISLNRWRVISRRGTSIPSFDEAPFRLHYKLSLREPHLQDTCQVQLFLLERKGQKNGTRKRTLQVFASFPKNFFPSDITGARLDKPHLPFFPVPTQSSHGFDRSVH